MKQHKTLVLGASEKPERYSNKAIRKLSEYNHPVIAIGNKAGFINDVEIKTEIGYVEDIHTITMYIGAANQPKYYDIITALKPKRIILNPGTENMELERIAEENNIEVLHACTLVLLSTNQY